MSRLPDEGDEPPYAEESDAIASEGQETTFVDEPGANDVLPGKGVGIMKYNRRFLDLVKQNKDDFRSSNKQQRERCCQSIVDEIASSDPPGRFLQKDTSNRWVKMTNKQAVERTRTAFHGANKPKKKKKTSSSAGGDDVPSVAAVAEVSSGTSIETSRSFANENTDQLFSTPKKSPPESGDANSSLKAVEAGTPELDALTLQSIFSYEMDHFSATGTLASVVTGPTADPSMVSASVISQQLGPGPRPVASTIAPTEPNPHSTESLASATTILNSDPMSTTSCLSQQLGSEKVERSSVSSSYFDPFGPSPSISPAMANASLKQVVETYRINLTQLKLWAAAEEPDFVAKAEKFERDLNKYEAFCGPAQDEDLDRDRFLKIAIRNSWKRLTETFST